MATLGSLQKNDTGSYTGVLNLMTGSYPLRMEPNPAKTREAQPDFRLFVNRAEIGAGWTREKRDGGGSFISIRLATPELPRTIYATLGQMAGQDDPDLYALIWSEPGAGA